MNRVILTRRDPGVEKLLGGLPLYAIPDRLEPLRRWAVSMMADASAWQMARRRNGLFGARGGHTHG